MTRSEAERGGWVPPFPNTLAGVEEDSLQAFGKGRRGVTRELGKGETENRSELGCSGFEGRERAGSGCM